jgi:hypothetical protein
MRNTTVENIEEAKKVPNNHAAQRRSNSRRADRFAEFDRARFMFVSTTGGITLWNRSLSMLANGHRPSAVALYLYEHFGVRVGAPSPHPDPERDQRVVAYFEKLTIPDDCPSPIPSIFDDHGGQA